jgi:putative iron-only hydrogenase system regulator
MDKRVGVIGIFLQNREQIAKINELLNEYSDMIAGRMGLPYKDRNMSVISLIVDGSTDEISALTGKIGRIPGVSIKSALSK